jgi:hypothetical protein
MSGGTTPRETGVPMMSVDRLSMREQAALLALMAAAREMTNAELHATVGLRIDGQTRVRLNEQKLVESRKDGQAYVHELTNDGWEWCRAVLSAPRPEGSTYVGGVLYSILSGLDRYLQRSDGSISSVFRPDVEAQIRGAYFRAGRKPGTWVKLAAIRSRIDGVPREEMDAAFGRMMRKPGVHLISQADQKALTEDDRQAALIIGGEPKHLLAIEA